MSGIGDHWKDVRVYFAPRVQAILKGLGVTMQSTGKTGVSGYKEN
jgi:hypothetical protein